MAIKKYRVLYGTHWFPNPEFKLDPATGMAMNESPSHIEAPKDSIIELEEARAEQFTKSWPGFPAKLALVSDSAGIPEITTTPPTDPELRSADAPKVKPTTMAPIKGTEPIPVGQPAPPGTPLR